MMYRAKYEITPKCCKHVIGPDKIIEIVKQTSKDMLLINVYCVLKNGKKVFPVTHRIKKTKFLRCCEEIK